LLSKIEGAAARLALVIHFARFAAGDPTMDDPNTIDAASVAAGVALACWFAQEGRRVYAIVLAGDEAGEQRELVEWIKRRGGRVTARDLQQGPRRFRGDAELAEAELAALVKAKVGHWVPILPDASGGRPGRCFELATTGNGYGTPEKPEENANCVAVASPTADEINNLLAQAAEEWEAA
jgi:hypothetical protein